MSIRTHNCYNIRRSGDWLSTEPDGTKSFTDFNAPVNPCVVTFNANRANFVFGVPGTINLLKNGGWLATTTGTYIDSGGTVADNYVARTRNAGTVIDFACTPG